MIAGDSSRPRSRRIVHVVSSLGVGGMERMLLQLAAEQQEAGDRVSVLALRGGALEQEASARSLRVRVLHSGRLSRGMQAVGFFLRERPQIVHVHNPTSLHYAVLSKLVSRNRIIVTLHGDQDTHARLGSALEWRLTGSAVIVSHAAGKTLQLSKHAGKFVVVHNGIRPLQGHTHADGDARDELPVPAGALVGVMVARIDGRKGHTTLLHALARLRDCGANVCVWVVGDGSERQNAERLSSELGLTSDSVRFLGRRSDIDRLLAAADFFVLPSDIEGLPMSILEAMTHALPIVASNVGGVPELIDDGRHGLLVPAGDAASLAGAIKRLRDDPGLRRQLGEAARHRASTDFSMSEMKRKYDLLYDEFRRPA
jgi:glycosyltransferase involved in cell wall biosynthesis